MRSLAARVAALIRVDAVWLAAEPIDMRAGTESALARVVKVFGAAHPHHAYLFANRRANRMKVLVHDGIGIWLCARRLNQGRFLWANASLGTQIAMTREQLDALLLGFRRSCIAASTSCCRTAGRPSRTVELLHSLVWQTVCSSPSRNRPPTSWRLSRSSPRGSANLGERLRGCLCAEMMTSQLPA
ncbi:IS66 Orf2 like protein [compost metagenome]